jgi:formiminoglutamase
MTEGLKIYTAADVATLINYRDGETKIGQKIQFVTSVDDLKNSTARFVLLGIPEDIGVRANHGIGGAATAWQPSLKSLLNVQSNAFMKGQELLLLGHFEIKSPEDTGTQSLQEKVSQIDELVAPVIAKITAAGKIPIIIGGGHNNAYPIIRGVSTAKNTAIDVINIDAHADLRAPQGRHSGNAFSYAIKDGFLKNYVIFGLHQSYNNDTMITEIAKNDDIHALFFDDLIQSNQPLEFYWRKLFKDVNGTPGLEIDLDCITDMLSSAMTPSGFSLNEIRKLVLTSPYNFSYLHICEGAVELTDGRTSSTTAKTISYLITDFIKSQQ